MSNYRRCDVCDTRYGDWTIRERWSIKRWSIKKWFGYMGYGNYEERDICDKCFDRFIDWIRRQNKRLKPC